MLSKFIELYKQRIRIIDEYVNIPIFPDLKQVEIYEDKRFLSYFLKARNIPYPGTRVFYYKNEALEYLKRSNYPLVGKISHGAAGTGVQILKNLGEARSYAHKAFSRGGVIYLRQSRRLEGYTLKGRVKTVSRPRRLNVFLTTLMEE